MIINHVINGDRDATLCGIDIPDWEAYRFDLLKRIQQLEDEDSCHKCWHKITEQRAAEDRLPASDTQRLIKGK